MADNNLNFNVNIIIQQAQQALNILQQRLKILNQNMALYGKVYNYMDEKRYEIIKAFEEERDSAINSAETTLIIIGLIIIGICLVISVLISKSIAKPIKKIGKMIKTISEEDGNSWML